LSHWTSGRAQESKCVFGWTETITPASTAAASAVEQAFTTTGQPVPLKAGDHIAVVGPGSGNNVAVGGARVNSTGQVVIQFINPTAGSLTHAAGVFFIKVSRL
jgi:hypothetical protein